MVNYLLSGVLPSLHICHVIQTYPAFTSCPTYRIVYTLSCLISWISYILPLLHPVVLFSAERC